MTNIRIACPLRVTGFWCDSRYCYTDELILGCVAIAAALGTPRFVGAAA
jgi:hypothetical protein